MYYSNKFRYKRLRGLDHTDLWVHRRTQKIQVKDILEEKRVCEIRYWSEVIFPDKVS